ncbi:MAG: hypothetical protein ABIH04_08380 [Planctomycetota bacterium]
MGSTLSKYLVAIGFILIFMALFVRTWKYGSPPHKAAGKAMWEQEVKVDTQEPLVLALDYSKCKFPEPVEAANAVNMPVEKFNNSPLKKIYDKREKDFNEGIGKELKEKMEKAEKGELDEQEEKIEELGDYAVRQGEFALRAGKIAQEMRDWENEVAEERAQRNNLSWHIGFLIYFGVFSIALGFIMLSITGEGNEKTGAIIALGLTLLFVVFFFGSVA